MKHPLKWSTLFRLYYFRCCFAFCHSWIAAEMSKFCCHLTFNCIDLRLHFFLVSRLAVLFSSDVHTAISLSCSCFILLLFRPIVTQMENRLYLVTQSPNLRHQWWWPYPCSSFVPVARRPASVYFFIKWIAVPICSVLCSLYCFIRWVRGV